MTRAVESGPRNAFSICRSAPLSNGAEARALRLDLARRQVGATRPRGLQASGAQFGVSYLTRPVGLEGDGRSGLGNRRPWSDGSPRGSKAGSDGPRFASLALGRSLGPRMARHVLMTARAHTTERRAIPNRCIFP